MKYVLLIMIIFSLGSCNEKKTKAVNQDASIKTEVISEIEIENIAEENVFSSYDTVHRMLQGSWSNAFEPDSVIVFKDKTTSNMYLDKIASKNIPYTLSTSCGNEVTTTLSEEYKYLTTKGASEECYVIKVLDDKKLEMEFERGNITLIFNRVE